MATNERKNTMATNEQKVNERESRFIVCERPEKEDYHILEDTNDFVVKIGNTEWMFYSIYESEKYIYLNLDIQIESITLHLKAISIAKESKRVYFPKQANSKYSSYYFDKEDIDVIFGKAFPELYYD